MHGRAPAAWRVLRGGRKSESKTFTPGHDPYPLTSSHLISPSSSRERLPCLDRSSAFIHLKAPSVPDTGSTVLEGRGLCSARCQATRIAVSPGEGDSCAGGLTEGDSWAGGLTADILREAIVYMSALSIDYSWSSRLSSLHLTSLSIALSILRSTISKHASLRARTPPHPNQGYPVLVLRQSPCI